MAEKSKEYKLAEKLETAKWRVDFVSEIFSLAHPEEFRLSESALCGLSCIMDDIRNEIEDVSMALLKR